LFQPRIETGIVIRVMEDTNNFDVISENMKIDCWDYRDHAAVLYQTQFFISVINQLDAQNFCFTISLFHAPTCFERMCSKHVDT